MWQANVIDAENPGKKSIKCLGAQLSDGGSVPPAQRWRKSRNPVWSLPMFSGENWPDQPKGARYPMHKADKRAVRRFRSRYGHTGLGASHTREASEAEVRYHVEKAKKNQVLKRR